jgi:ribosomal protein S27AE
VLLFFISQPIVDVDQGPIYTPASAYFIILLLIILAVALLDGLVSLLKNMIESAESPPHYQIDNLPFVNHQNCPRCGIFLSEKGLFCSKCGNILI